MGTRMMTDRRVDFGKSGKHDDIFPNEVHVKHMKSGEGAGEMHNYPDTEEEVVRYQDEGIKQINNKKMKAGFRN